MPNPSFSTRPSQASVHSHSTVMCLEDPRVDLLTEYRRRRGEVYRANRVARDAANAASIVEEWAGETEGQLLRDLRRNGPLVHDGRRYSAEKRDGIFCVVVRTEEGGGL